MARWPVTRWHVFGATSRVARAVASETHGLEITTGKAAKGKGVKARMATLSPEERKALASKAAKARWDKAQKKNKKP